MLPATRYAKSGGINIAFQTVGHGPRDLVLVPGWVSNLDVFWEEPALARHLRAQVHVAPLPQAAKQARWQAASVPSNFRKSPDKSRRKQ